MVGLLLLLLFITASSLFSRAFSLASAWSAITCWISINNQHQISSAGRDHSQHSILASSSLSTLASTSSYLFECMENKNSTPYYHRRYLTIWLRPTQMQWKSTTPIIIITFQRIPILLNRCAGRFICFSDTNQKTRQSFKIISALNLNRISCFDFFEHSNSLRATK